MCYFVQIKNNYNIQSVNPALRWTDKLQNCYNNYFYCFQDDFSSAENNVFSYIENTSPFFWLIFSKKDNEFMGFVSLDNFIGNGITSYSAEITTCFDKCAWGDFTRYSAKFFLKYCFDKFGFTKIKAQIYPDNFRVKNLLKNCGFQYESTLKNETVRKSKMQNIDIYALYRSYYYKNEVKND